MSNKNQTVEKDYLVATSHTWANNPKLLQVLNQIDFSAINKINPKKEFIKSELPRSEIYFAELFTGLEEAQMKALFQQSTHWLNEAEIQFIIDSWRFKENRFLQLKAERDAAKALSLKVGKQLQGFKAKFKDRTRRDLHFIKAGFKPTIHLLLIGIDDYPGKSQDLRGCVKDVQDIAEVFKKQEEKLYKKVNLELLLNEKATISNIIENIEDIIKKAQPLDYVFIYFSGHAGSEDLDKDGEKDGFFCAYPADGEATINEKGHKMFYAPLEGEKVCNLLMDSKSTVLLFSDFCHAESFIQPLIDANHSTEVHQLTHNVFAMSACKAEETAGEQADGGFFSQAVKRCFETKEADLDNNGVIYLDELYQYVLKEVAKQREEQTPVVCIPTTTVNIPILQFGDKFNFPERELLLSGHIEDEEVIENILATMLPLEAQDLFATMTFDEIISHRNSFGILPKQNPTR